MVSLSFLRIWHYLSLVVTVMIGVVLLYHYGKTWFFEKKAETADED